jgi:hypothetical protein
LSQPFLAFCRASAATFPIEPRWSASREGVNMTSWSDGYGIDPVAFATALFGIVTAVILVTAV